jgi:hypothetical protein
MISSWASSSKNIDLGMEPEAISIDFYQENSIWDLVYTSIDEVNLTDRFEYQYSDYKMESVVFNLHLKRRPLYFLINGFFYYNN